MTVTALAHHPAYAAYANRAGHALRPVPQQQSQPAVGPRPQPVPTDSAPIAQTGTAVNVTIELSLPLEHAGQGLEETLDALRAAVGRLGAGQVHVGPGGPGVSSGAANGVTSGVTSGAAGPTRAARPGDDQTVRILRDERSVWWGSREIHLSRLEFDLLVFFADHPRKVFSRRQLLESVWGYTHASRRTVDVHIRRLRMKLDAAGPLLTTVRGVGYRLDNAARVSVVRHNLAA
jgi:two-component system, OmpR family, response regulator MtrA